MKSRQGRARVELPVSVRDALDVLRPVPALDSDAWAANRVAFLDEAHAYAQEVASLPASESTPASWWGRFCESVVLVKAFLLHDRGPVAVALKAVLVIALALAVSTGTVSAARGSLPGSLLYPLKVRLEAWEINQARTPEAVARAALAQTDIRVGEASRLQSRGDPVPEETAVRYQQQLALAVRAVEDVDESLRQQTQGEITESVRRQLRTLEAALAPVHGDAMPDDAAESDPGIEAMIRTIRDMESRLGDGEDQRPGQAVPPNPSYSPDDPAPGEEGDAPSVSEPAMTGHDNAPSGWTTPAPGDVSDDPADQGPAGSKPSGGGSDTEMPPKTDNDNSGDKDAPGPDPTPTQEDQTDPHSPGSGSGSDDGADGSRMDIRDGTGGSDVGSQSGHSKP